MAQAQAALDKGNYSDAMAATAKARQTKPNAVQMRQLMSFMGKLNDAGQAKLDGYLKMLQDKDYLPAIKGISMVSRIFGTLSCAKAAATALDKAANDPDTKDVVAKVKADELAEAKAHAAASCAPAPTTAPSTQPADCHPQAGTPAAFDPAVRHGEIAASPSPPKTLRPALRRPIRACRPSL